MRLEQALQRISREVQADNPRYRFAPGATVERIDDLERELGVQLPRSFRTFLTVFDGGFVCPEDISPPFDRAAVKWNSNAIFGVDELRKEYLEQAEIETLDRGWKGHWPFIPVIHTEGQELLVFRNPLDDRGESPVLDAFHELGPREWNAVYPNFESLLVDYTERAGRIEQIGKTPKSRS